MCAVAVKSHLWLRLKLPKKLLGHLCDPDVSTCVSLNCFLNNFGTFIHHVNLQKKFKQSWNVIKFNQSASHKVVGDTREAKSWQNGKAAASSCSDKSPEEEATPACKRWLQLKTSARSLQSRHFYQNWMVFFLLKEEQRTALFVYLWTVCYLSLWFS